MDPAQQRDPATINRAAHRRKSPVPPEQERRRERMRITESCTKEFDRSHFHLHGTTTVAFAGEWVDKLDRELLESLVGDSLALHH